MKNPILLLLLLLFVFSCEHKEKTDAQVLEDDQLKLQENHEKPKVTFYKFGKMLIKSSALEDTLTGELQPVKTDLDSISRQVMKYYNKSTNSFSPKDFFSLYREYKRMEDFILKTEEDHFPTLTDAFNAAYTGGYNKGKDNLAGSEKGRVQNIEHTVLSASLILSNRLGKEISLYEGEKINPDLLPEGEVKSLTQYFKGFLFFNNGLYYLSEAELSKNINWLENHREVELPYTRAMFNWDTLSNQKAYTGFRSLNYLFRGLDRIMMGRKIDEERAIEDFETFLQGAEEIGMDNEIFRSVKSYLDARKANAGEAFFDRRALSKMVTDYMLSLLNRIDWKKILADRGVPNAGEMMDKVEDSKKFLENLGAYINSDDFKNYVSNLVEAGTDIKDKGEVTWNKIRALVE